MDISLDPGSILNGFVGNLVNWGVSNRNYEFQREQFEYQKHLNNLTMAREDSAVQRKMADLQKAGLSPYLATGGGGASTSHLVSAPAPQNNFQMSPISMGQMNWKTNTEKRILTAQAKQAEAEAEMKDKQKDISFRNPWLLFGNNIGAVTAFLDSKFPGLIDKAVSNPSEVINDAVNGGLNSYKQVINGVLNSGVNSVKEVIKGSSGIEVVDDFIHALEKQSAKAKKAKEERAQAKIDKLSDWYDALSSRLSSLPSALVKDFKLISKDDFLSLSNRKRKKIEKDIKYLEDMASAYKNRR